MAGLVLDIERRAIAEYKAAHPEVNYVNMCKTCNEFITIEEEEYCPVCKATYGGTT